MGQLGPLLTMARVHVLPRRQTLAPDLLPECANPPVTPVLLSCALPLQAAAAGSLPTAGFVDWPGFEVVETEEDSDEDSGDEDSGDEDSGDEEPAGSEATASEEEEEEGEGYYVTAEVAGSKVRIRAGKPGAVSPKRRPRAAAGGRGQKKGRR